MCMFKDRKSTTNNEPRTQNMKNLSEYVLFRIHNKSCTKFRVFNFHTLFPLRVLIFAIFPETRKSRKVKR